jgi:hypothetical protein
VKVLDAVDGRLVGGTPRFVRNPAKRNSWSSPTIAFIFRRIDVLALLMGVFALEGYHSRLPP